MKSVRWIVLLVVLVGQYSYADSVRTVNIRRVSMLILPNTGGGENVGFQFTSPGTNIEGIAGTNCFDWCGEDNFRLVPGSSLNASTGLFFDFLQTVKIRGTTFDNESSYIFMSSLFGGSFVFPLNGQPFTITTSASLGTPLTLFLSDGSTVLLKIPAGTLTLSFGFQPAVGDLPAHYFFTEGHYEAITTIPEPGTIALVATGLASLGTIGRRRMQEKKAESLESGLVRL